NRLVAVQCVKEIISADEEPDERDLAVFDLRNESGELVVEHVLGGVAILGPVEFVAGISRGGARSCGKGSEVQRAVLCQRFDKIPAGASIGRIKLVFVGVAIAEQPDAVKDIDVGREKSPRLESFDLHRIAKSLHNL